jgi:3-hydroxyisobutyrate dehydrogenase
MGANMARRLRDCGDFVAVVHDARADAALELARELGCKAASTLAEVTSQAKVVFTVVSDDAAMRHIFAAPGRSDSLLRGARGRLFINCATLSPKVHIEIARASRKAGASALEACMASSIPQAREGRLYLMCGGEPRDFKRARPLLEKLSASLRFIGPPGQAATLKALVNMVMNINTAGLAEGLALADACGLDLDMVREVFAQTGAASQVLKTDGEDMQNREHSCFFSAEHAAKDSGIALALAVSRKINLPIAAATCRQYKRMVTEGLGSLDKSGIAELVFRGRRRAKR